VRQQLPRPVGDLEWVAAGADRRAEKYGYGLSSVRFICGTQTVHKELEQALSEFLGTEDTILYAAAFDANGGVFEPLFDENDAIISDALNHASIIDGIRLCKAARYRYANNDMADLEVQLQARGRQAPQSHRHRRRVLDGRHHRPAGQDLRPGRQVRRAGDDRRIARFRLHGQDRPRHPRTPQCHGPIDIITGTLGKALGGAMGGFTSARKEVIEMLRQKSRPYLFSNTLAPMIAGASLAVLERMSSRPSCATACTKTPPYFRKEIERIGFTIKPGTHPVVPVMLFDAPVAQKFAARMYRTGRAAVSGFFYPVVPMGQARVRVQLSAAHTREQLDTVLKAFEQAGNELGMLKKYMKIVRNNNMNNSHQNTHGTHPHHRRQRPDRQ
jgi:glycine C-acetyltransferase